MNGIMPIEWDCCECGERLPAQHLTFHWFGTIYHVCGSYCRKIKIRKLIAAFNLKEGQA